MTIVLPHGVLFRGGEEGEIRKNLIENNNIDAVIGLPANIFFGTGIPTIIMVLKQKRENTNVLIVDASKYFEKVGKNNVLKASDIKRIVDTVVERRTVDKFSRVVEREEIRENEYNLNIPRYVDSSEAIESWDIHASIAGGIPDSEIEMLRDYWAVFPELRKDLFISDSTPYSKLTVKEEEIADFIISHNDVQRYTELFNKNFSMFRNYLITELISKLKENNISVTEEEISNEIFHGLENVPLIDRYEAYQILDDVWTDIEGDLEIIAQDGFDAGKMCRS